MRLPFPILVVAALVGGGASCSSAAKPPAGAPLDCAWLASENCWKTTAQAAAPCLPPATETGTLSADNRTCTYASGTVITFAQPVVLPATTDANWDFTIGSGGQTCMHFVWRGVGFTLEVGDQKVTEQLGSAASLTLTCPDGVTHTLTSVQEIFNCPDAGAAGGLPGISVASVNTSVSFYLVDTSSDFMSASLLLFDCRKP